MAEAVQLRAYCYLDRMQPQFAAYVGTITQGDLPIEGMAALYVEIAPGNEVFRVVDAAVKATEAKPGAQIVEREFGMLEVHSLSQAAVLEAGRVILKELNLKENVPRQPTLTWPPTKRRRRPTSKSSMFRRWGGSGACGSPAQRPKH